MKAMKAMKAMQAMSRKGQEKPGATWKTSWVGKHVGLAWRWKLVSVKFKAGVVTEEWKGFRRTDLTTTKFTNVAKKAMKAKKPVEAKTAMKAK
jgi:hypothetical protein